MKKFNFRKWIKRNDFTTVFGGFGERRTLKDFTHVKKFRKSWIRFKMVQIRRAHQGWRNRVYGSIMGLKLRLKFGRRKKVPQFRR